MRITIKGRIDENLVAFESDLGHGLAIWEHNKPLSKVTYDTELEIDDFFEWGKNIALEKSHEVSINFINNTMVFKARVISCDDGGLLVLSLGEDVIFIETSAACERDSYVSFFTTPDNVLLYPVEL